MASQRKREKNIEQKSSNLMRKVSWSTNKYPGKVWNKSGAQREKIKESKNRQQEEEKEERRDC